MLEYLYTLDYTPKARGDSFDAPLGGHPVAGTDTYDIRDLPSVQLVRSASLYSMGEKYGIYGLKKTASEKFAAVFINGTEHVYGDWASNIDTGALRTATRRIYDTRPEPDKGPRDHVLEYAKLHLERLLPREDFKAMLAEVPEFSYRLLVQVVESRGPEGPVSKKKGTRLWGD